MKKCEWCDKEYNEIKADRYQMDNNLQYRWDSFNYCSEECCNLSWESLKMAESENKILDIDILSHENLIMREALNKILHYEVEEGEWCETAEAFYWFAKHCISELDDKS